MAFGINIAEVWRELDSDEEDMVAIIPNDFFFIEKVSLEGVKVNAVQTKKIVQNKLLTMIPEEATDIVHGYFTDIPNKELIILAASKNRILEAKPEIKKTRYWIPAEYILKTAQNHFSIKKAEIETKTIESINTKDSGFWTAELHTPNKKAANKIRALTKKNQKKITNITILSTIILPATIIHAHYFNNKPKQINSSNQEKHISPKAIERLKLITTPNKPPLETLNQINKARPSKTLYFTKYTQTKDGNIEIDLNSPTSELVKIFKENIQNTIPNTKTTMTNTNKEKKSNSQQYHIIIKTITK